MGYILWVVWLVLGFENMLRQGAAGDPGSGWKGARYHLNKIATSGGYSSKNSGDAHYGHNGNVDAYDTNRHYDVSDFARQRDEWVQQVQAERAAHNESHHQLWDWGSNSIAPNASLSNHLANGVAMATRVPDVKRPFELVGDGAGGYVGYGGPVTSAHVYGADFVRHEDNSTGPLPFGQGLVVPMAGGIAAAPYRYGGFQRPPHH